jgi:predicted DNA-binding protein
MFKVEMVSFNIKFKKSTVERLDRLAEFEGRTTVGQIRFIINEYFKFLDKEELIEKIQLEKKIEEATGEKNE